jgi:uncharacterized membrane protein YkvA (DUF1232 family)
LWRLSPIDLLPEFLPVIGPLDDVVVVALALRYAARQVPREVLAAAWPGEARLLERLIGSPDPATGQQAGGARFVQPITSRFSVVHQVARNAVLAGQVEWPVQAMRSCDAQRRVE